MTATDAFTFDAGTGRLVARDGRDSVLRPQTAKVFDLLIAHAGQLVTKDQLMEAVWKDTFVTDDSLVQCISEIRRALGSADAARLVTVPRKGYRLDVAPAQPISAGRPPRRMLTAGIALVLSITVGLAAFWLAPRPLPAPERPAPSLAVMPFANMGGEAEGYFSDGIAEDLIVSLSDLSDLRVVARSASFALARQIEDPRALARELNVAYLVDGTVRRDAGALRLTATLIDGETGESLWAERFEGNPAEVLDFQEAVLQELVRVLAVRLSPTERARLGVRGTADVEAFDAYLLGISLENELTRAANLRAEEAFSEALRRDPDYAAAHAHLSLTLSMRAEYGWSDSEAETADRAMTHARRAVELDPDLPFARFALGRLLSRQFFGDIEGALSEFRAAITLDPHYDDASAFMANVLVFDGRAEEALPAIEAAYAANPYPPYWYAIPLALSRYFTGDYAAARDALTEALERNPNSPHATRILIATLGRLGELDEAEWLAMEYEMQGGSATVAGMMDTSSIHDPAYRNAFAEGLRLAGLPED